MKEILEKVRATELREFKRLAMARIGWNQSQFSDRKTGRVRLLPLERNELELILMDMRKKEGAPIDPVFCTDDCMLHRYNRCPFDKLEECPMYNPIKRDDL